METGLSFSDRPAHSPGADTSLIHHQLYNPGSITAAAAAVPNAFPCVVFYVATAHKVLCESVLTGLLVQEVLPVSVVNAATLVDLYPQPNGDQWPPHAGRSARESHHNAADIRPEPALDCVVSTAV